VRWHVVGSLVVVLPSAALGRKLRHPAAEVAQNGRVGVLLNQETARGVLDEHGAQSDPDAALVDHSLYLWAEVEKPCPGRSDLERFLVYGHGGDLCDHLTATASIRAIRYE
jgi:hypothetical protein